MPHVLTVAFPLSAGVHADHLQRDHGNARGSMRGHIKFESTRMATPDRRIRASANARCGPIIPARSPPDAIGSNRALAGYPSRSASLFARTVGFLAECHFQGGDQTAGYSTYGGFDRARSIGAKTDGTGGCAVAAQPDPRQERPASGRFREGKWHESCPKTCQNLPKPATFFTGSSAISPVIRSRSPVTASPEKRRS